MTGRLSTHVLDTSIGRPAAGVRITLRRVGSDGVAGEVLVETVTNADGRTDQPLLSGEQFTAGVYELCFAVGDYFATGSTGSAAVSVAGTTSTGRVFLDIVPVRFGATGTETLHVPLLVTPWSYSTYRGS